MRFSWPCPCGCVSASPVPRLQHTPSSWGPGSWPRTRLLRTGGAVGCGGRRPARCQRRDCSPAPDGVSASGLGTCYSTGSPPGDLSQQFPESPGFPRTEGPSGCGVAASGQGAAAALRGAVDLSRKIEPFVAAGVEARPPRRQEEEPAGPTERPVDSPPCFLSDRARTPSSSLSSTSIPSALPGDSSPSLLLTVKIWESGRLGCSCRRQVGAPLVSQGVAVACRWPPFGSGGPAAICSLWSCSPAQQPRLCGWSTGSPGPTAAVRTALSPGRGCAHVAAHGPSGVLCASAPSGRGRLPSALPVPIEVPQDPGCGVPQSGKCAS